MENKRLTGSVNLSAPVDLNWHPTLCILCVPVETGSCGRLCVQYNTVCSICSYICSLFLPSPSCRTHDCSVTVCRLGPCWFIYLSICLCRHTNIQELRNMTCCELRLNLDLIILIVSTAILEIQAIAAFKSHFLCVCGGRRLFLVYVL